MKKNKHSLVNMFVNILLICVVVFAFMPVVKTRLIDRPKAEKNIEQYFKLNQSKFSVGQSLLDMKGVIYIPKADIKLPIFKGTSEMAMKYGVGLVDDINLDAKAGTNPILTTHNGSTDNQLFANIIKLKKNDSIYIKNKKDILHYKVINVKEITPVDERSKFLRPPANKSYITLRTCVPIFVNTHRLIVTGEFIGAEKSVPKGKINLSKYEVYLIGIGSIALLMLIVVNVKDRKKRRR